MLSDFDPSTVSYPLDREEVDDLLGAIESAEEVVYDLETSGLDAYADDATITVASFTLPQARAGEPPTYVLPLAHPDSPLSGTWREVAHDVFAAVLRNGSTIGHNVKFDARWVHAHTGVDLSGTVTWDTQVGAHLLDENRSTKLKEVAPARFNIERWDDVDLSTPGAANRVPFFDLAIYAARDTYWTWRESVEQRREVGATDLDRTALDPTLEDDRTALRLGRLAVRLVMPTVRTLTAVEQRGFRLDIEETSRRLTDMHRQADDARDALHRLDPDMRRVGEQENLGESWEPGARWFRRYTERALEQGRLRVVEMTPNGKPSWGKTPLRRLARDGLEVAEAILSYRHATKRAQYLRAWLEHVGPDGRVHAGYNVGSVVTGRLSSSNPNMQQVSGDLKPCWIGSPGTLVAEVDYSQIELRAAAYVARCEPMLKAYNLGLDLHLTNAAQVASDEALRAAHVLLVRADLPPDRTGAEVLRILRDSAGKRPITEELLQTCRLLWTDQESGSRDRRSAGTGAQSQLERGSVSTLLQEVPADLVRRVREYRASRGASQEPRPIEQPSLELADAVSLVSRTGARTLEQLSGDPWGDLRQRGKAISFGFLYGMGSAGFQTYADDTYGVVFTEEQAELARATFFRTWDGLERWHRSIVRTAQHLGHVSSPLGRLRRLPTIYDRNERTHGHAERQAINSPIQSFASDLMQLAAARIEGTLPEEPGIPHVSIVATVHDSIVVEVPEDDWKRSIARTMRGMLDLSDLLAPMDVTLDVPLEVEAKVGPRWGKTFAVVES